MNEIDCRKCTHSTVCKHRERMVEELKKFNEIIHEPPLKVTISCDEYIEHKPTLRDPLVIPTISPWLKPFGTGQPLTDDYTYTTDDTTGDSK